MWLKRYTPAMFSIEIRDRPPAVFFITAKRGGTPLTIDKPLTIKGDTVISAVIPATSGNINIYMSAGVKRVVLEAIKIVGTDGAWGGNARSVLKNKGNRW